MLSKLKTSTIWRITIKFSKTHQSKKISKFFAAAAKAQKSKNSDRHNLANSREVFFLLLIFIRKSCIILKRPFEQHIRKKGFLWLFIILFFVLPAGDELLYEGDSDKLMRDLKFAVDGPNRTRTVLVEDEKLPIRKEVFEELSQIKKSFGKEKITGFDIFDSFQYSKKQKFSVEFLEENTIEVIRIKEE